MKVSEELYGEVLGRPKRLLGIGLIAVGIVFFGTGVFYYEQYVGLNLKFLGYQGLPEECLSCPLILQAAMSTMNYFFLLSSIFGVAGISILIYDKLARRRLPP